MLGWNGCDIVHCGFWLNEINEKYHRAILTLPSQWSLILVGFLALFIKLSSSYLWSTIRFIIHQIRSSPKDKDDLYHQMQLVLRNTETETTFVESLIQLAWARKGARFEAYRRCILLVILGTLYGLGFGAASGLSSTYLTANGGGALSLASHCGWLEEPDFSNIASFAENKTIEIINSLVIMSRNNFRRSATYSRSCYGSFGGNLSACGTYVQPRLPAKVTRELPCPFAPEICNGTAISFDSGYIESDKHLGINTRPEDSISFRKVMTCVPVAAEKYTPGWQPIPPEAAAMLEYPLEARFKPYALGYNPSTLSLFNQTNYTIVADDILWKFGDQPYNLWWANSFLDLPPLQNFQSKSFFPIPELRNTTADLVLISMTNRNEYRTAVTDPFFSAENCSTDPMAIIPTTCRPQNPLNFMACQEQYQFCTSPDKASNTHCTNLTGLYPLSNPPPSTLPLNPTQSATQTLLWKLLWTTQLNFQLGFIGRENLLAHEYLWDGGFNFGISAPLSPTHWQTEAANWFNVTLSSLQRGIVNFARPADFDLGGSDSGAGAGSGSGSGSGSSSSTLTHIIPPTSTTLAALCDKIRIQSPHHTSFSVLGLAITLILGLFFIITNLLLVCIVETVQRRSGRGAHKRLEWIESSSFQLQRLAAEGRGIGPWEGREKDVPRLVGIGGGGGGEGKRGFNLTSDGVRYGGNGYGGDVYGHGYENGHGHRREGSYRNVVDSGVAKGGVTTRLLEG